LNSLLTVLWNAHSGLLSTPALLHWHVLQAAGGAAFGSGGLPGVKEAVSTLCFVCSCLCLLQVLFWYRLLTAGRCTGWILLSCAGMLLRLAPLLLPLLPGSKRLVLLFDAGAKGLRQLALMATAGLWA
jgi:hypothetical protein